MNNKIFLIIIGIFALIGFTTSANYYASDPNNCPVSYQSQTCSGSDVVCGANGGVTYCYDPASLTAPGSTSTTGSGGTNYACSDTTCDGGFIVDCYAYDGSAPHCDNSGSFLIDRNSTCYNKHTQTTATDFATSTCSATCTTNYFACDSDTTDADGCEIHATASCGSSTGTIVLNQCYSSSAGNCTSATNLDCDNSDSDGDTSTCNVGNGCEITPGASCGSGTGTYASAQCSGTSGNCTSVTRLDCNDDDSDGDPATCNSGDGCEILIGGSCSVGAVSGTYDNYCSGGAGVCVVADQDIATSGQEVSWSSSTDPFLWLHQYGSSPIVNFTTSNNNSFIINDTGTFTGGNLTITQKITFALGELIDNLVDGWLKITGSLWVTGDVNVTGNLNATNITASYYCNATNCYQVADFLSGGSSDGTGGWLNDSIQTNTSLNVNLYNGNLTLNGSNSGIHLENNATISRNGTGTKIWFSESGNIIERFA